MPYRTTSSRRVSYSTWNKMTPAQKAAKSRAVNRSRRVYKSRRSTAEPTAVTVARAPTIGGTSVGTSLLTKTPLFPIRKYVKSQLYYEDGIIRTTTVGGTAIYTFSANGLFDPNITGTGHQPIGFDQMMALYEHYTVIRSHIKVTFFNSSAEPARVAIYLSPDNITPSRTAIMENGLIKTRMISGDTGAGTHRQATIELTCDVPKYFGKSYQSILAETEMSGTIAANPAEQVYFVIAIWNPVGIDDANVGLDVVLSYDSMYWEPKKLASS